MAASTTPAQYALILIDLARERGIETSALLRGSSIEATGLAGMGARVSDHDFHQLVNNALALSDEPGLGLLLGERLNLGAHAVLGQAFLTCGDLGEVMLLFKRYYHLLAPDLDLTFEQDDARVSIATASVQADLPLTFGLECIAGAMRNTIGGLLGDSDFPLCFEFPYPEPPHRPLYDAILGSDVHFDRPTARWSFSRFMLQRRLPSSNPAMRALYEAECARLLADLEGSGDLTAQTRRLLRKLEGQYPQMPQIASMLNVSARTYRRRLAAENTSFQTLLDEARAEHATRHLREGRLSIASIAYHLGFNDPSNFRRAYRRWTGESPSSVRRSSRELRESLHH